MKRKPPRRPTAARTLRDRLRALEAENAALRLRVAALEARPVYPTYPIIMPPAQPVAPQPYNPLTWPTTMCEVAQ